MNPVGDSLPQVFVVDESSTGELEEPIELKENDSGYDLFRKVRPLTKPESDSPTMSSHHEESDNSTWQPRGLPAVAQRVGQAFAIARDQVFEDGIESEFSRQLTHAVLSYGKPAVDVLARFVLSGSVNNEVKAEALRVIGRMEQPATHRDRLWLLERGLYDSSSRVRDGAILGLAFLDDPLAATPLRYAIERETIPELREDMKQVLEQLAD